MSQWEHEHNRCNATIQFGDDHGDNSATFHCKLEKGHSGEHKETGNMGDEKYGMPYTLTWEGDQKEVDEAFEREMKEMCDNCKHEEIRVISDEHKYCFLCGLAWINGEEKVW